MAVFVELEESDVEAQQDGQPPLWKGDHDPIKAAAVNGASTGNHTCSDGKKTIGDRGEEAHKLAVREVWNQNSATQAFRCYPILMSMAAHIDLNTLDSLSRTCRLIHDETLANRKTLLSSTLRCVNDHLPVNPEDTFRNRARASNLFSPEDGHTSIRAPEKAGKCARDLVSECRQCGTVVCRNCAIKAPSRSVLSDRHRRLCVACTEAPLGELVKPRLGPEFTLASHDVKRAVCGCDSSEGVFLCQPCGRSIRYDDLEYKRIWRWRNLYTASLGGLGTGITEGIRGAICARDSECCAAHELEQETDCDAADARDADNFLASLMPLSQTSSNASLAPWSSGQDSTSGSPGSPGSSGGMLPNAAPLDRRTPSPQLGPGYERHEIEGIGGVVKKKLVRMIKVGACVPEWDDERQNGVILGREVSGKRRSWCGWCNRVIPGEKDYAPATRKRLAKGGKGLRD